MVNPTLFLANVVILVVMAGAFATAFRTQQRDRYLASWTWANLVIALSLLIFTFSQVLPPIATAAGANTLLLLGFGLRWRAIREFGGQPAPLAAVLAPMMAYLALGTLPTLLGQAGLVYGLVNILLAGTVAGICLEIASERRERLPARIGLWAVYAIMGCSFGVRGVQGLINPLAPEVLPQDLMLTLHLSVALVHTTGSGAFALAMAFERQTAGLRRAALTDWLTGLANRRAFDLALSRALLAAPADGSAVIAFDLDHFKQVNDRHGHAMGDAVLIAVAEAARDALAGEEGTLARIGGEEFAAIVPGLGPDKARALAERVRIAIACVRLPGEKTLAVTVSVGVYAFRGGEDGDGVMRAVDAALYRAKHNGRNRVEIARPNRPGGTLVSGAPLPSPFAEAGASGAGLRPLAAGGC